MDKNYEEGILLGVLTEKISLVRNLLVYPEKISEKDIKGMLGVSDKYAAHLIAFAKESQDDDMEAALCIIEEQGLGSDDCDDAETKSLRNRVIRENEWLVGRLRKREFIDFFKKDYFDKFGMEIEVEEIGGLTAEVDEE